MTATIIDTTAVLKVVVSSLVAGVGVTAVFAIGIYGAARASDMRRMNNAGAASRYAVLSVVAVAACLAAIAYGIVLTTQKS